MKKRRDVFDAFRESGQQLKATPSSSAWRKLEGKLDAQRRRRRIQFFGITSIAAVLAFVVALAAILPLLDNARQTAYAKTENPAPQSFETLIPVSEADEAPIRAVEFSRQHERAARPIAEGSSGQKLVLAFQAESGGSK
ncbi:MAG: hypothetical protein SH848_07735 [Saprospiraceae bacterium]|nr:hypothetical protein [Saprospiraceae bacterium]MDZ4703803.1 hypothetical protein [Saprospiraceae bacterium]